MQSELKKLHKIQESINFYNARKDFIEFFIYEVYKELKTPIVFVNEGISEERIIKNFSFLNKDLKVINACYEDDSYSFKLNNLLENAKRNKALNDVLNAKFDVLCLDYKLVLRKLPMPDFYKETLKLEVGARFGHSNLTNKLFEFGFLRQDTVFDFGEYAVRGFIVDVGTLEGFFRIEFEGETISSICKFNTESQRKNLNEIIQMLEISKIKEIILKDGWVQNVRKNAFEMGFEEASSAVNEITNLLNVKLDAFLPLFYEKTASVLDFIPQNATIITLSSLQNTLDFYLQNAQDVYNLYKKEGKNLLPPNLLFWKKEDLLAKFKPNITLECEYKTE